MSKNVEKMSKALKTEIQRSQFSKIQLEKIEKMCLKNVE